MNNLRTAARNTLKDCLGIKVGEQVVVIADEPSRKISKLFGKKLRI